MHPPILHHGSLNPLPKSIQLHAGKLNLQYEGGFLRYIRIGETEVLRMINHYIRDENWANIPMVIMAENIDHGNDSFSISYTAECSRGNVKFRWNCSILGKADSSITFSIEGVSQSSFKRNRLGFTVLHPIQNCAGKECVILHSDNTKETFIFPEFVSPHQPFFDITAMFWQPSEGVEAQVHFIGDIFETEDQRNWTDDSFKTYCTPLSRPFPVLVKRGDVVNQTIHFKASATKVFRKHAEQPSFTIEKQSRTAFPKIGVPLSNLPHDESSVQHLTRLGIDFIRLEIKQGADISRQLQQAHLLGLPLEIVLYADKQFDIATIEKLVMIKDKIIQFIILPLVGKSTGHELIAFIVPLLRKAFPHSKVGGGTDTFFTELNRERTPATLLDFFTFSINPQAHAFDINTVTENLRPQRDAVHSCRAFVEGKEIHVGPVTFKTRWNAGAPTKEEKKITKGSLPDHADPRQLSLYGAAWTMGSIKHLAESGVAAITYFETCGWLGLLPHRLQPWPADFLVVNESVYPVYIVLKEILRHKSKQVVRLTASNPLQVDGLAFVADTGAYHILLANYTDQEQPIALPHDVIVNSYHTIDATNMEDYMLNPEKDHVAYKIEGQITIPPFGIVMIW